ncbi:MAG: hypothetical protein MJ204_05970 [Bacteroidales bacterium]|nr:hypothetical protein [Bacteroidales bacterium]
MRKPLLVLLVQFVAIHAVFAQLEIETIVPTGFDEAINVGVGTGHFETIVKNKSGVETVTGIKVTPLGGLDGMEILTNATYEYNGTVYSASVTGDVIKTVGSLRLMAGEQIKFIYEKRAKCSIVPQASSGYSMQVVDDITVLGTNYSGQTNSYPVLFPGLSVIVPESPLNNMNVEYGESFSDHFTIRNEPNAGPVQFLTLTIVWAIPQALEIDSVKINGVYFNIGSSTDSSVVLQLDSSRLSSLEFTEGVFRSSSELQVDLYGLTKAYFPNMQVRYNVDYYSQNIVCREFENSEGVMYFRQDYPNTDLSLDLETVQLANWCGTPYIGEFTVKNKSTQSGNNVLLDSYLTFDESYSLVDRVICEGQELLRTSDGKFYLPTGYDKNRNGISSDLISGQSLHLQVYATAKVPSSMSYVNFIVNLNGQNVVGKKISTFDIQYDGVYNTEMHIDGPGTIDEKTLPVGNYTLSYSADRYMKDSKLSSFIDYDLYVTSPNSSGEKLPIDSKGKYEGVLERSIHACISDDIYFSMEARTNGCPQSVKVKTEIADVVQRCYDTIQGCYNIIVDTAYLDKKSVGTCESVIVNAQARLDYHCSDSCVRPSGIIVEIFDHNRQLNDFYISSIVINNSVAEVYDTTQKYSKLYRCNYSAICPEGEDTVIRTEIPITATIEMPHKHLLKNRVDANIQVGIGIEVNDSNLMSLYSWGERLVVYDSKPTFDSFVSVGGCGDIGVDVDMEKSDYTGLSGIRIEKVDFPGFENIYYKDQSLKTINEGLTINKQYYVKPGGCEYISTDLYSQCATNSMRTNKDSKIVVTYIDFADKPECAERKQVGLSTANLRYYSPIIQLYPTEKQQSIGQTTTWTVRVVNEGHETAENVMLKFTINPENMMDLYVENIYVAGNKIVDYEQNEDGSFFVNIGSLSINQIRDTQIEVSYRNCQSNGTSTISVESAWSCEKLTENNFNDFNCGGTAELELENMVAVLNVVETYPKEYFHLCEDIPIHLNISNIGRADLNQLGFWFSSLPNIYAVTNDALMWSYNGQTNEISGVSSSYSSNSILSQNVLTPNKGVLSGASYFDIDFNIQMHCRTDNGISNRIGAIEFLVGGYTNCLVEQQRRFRFTPNFEEFKDLDSLSVQATVDDRDFEYGGVRNFTATVQNLSNALVDSAYVTITIPNNLQYMGYDATRSTGVVDEEIIDNNDGTTTVEWKLQEGIHLAPHEQITVYYQLQAKQLCGQALEVLTQGTLLRKMRDCDGTECDFKNSTGAVTLTVTTPNPQLSATISEIESTCKGNKETYIVSDIGIESIEWTVSPETIGTITSNGQTANLHYTEKGVATISANVVGSCETLHLNTQTTVLDKPNFSITPPDSILWKDWNELGVRAVSTEYAESNWTIPQIDTCGQYTLTYEETNECGSVRECIPIEIYRCCEPEKVNMPDTLHISYSDWESFTLDSIKVTPENGKWDTLKIEPHGMCGEYKYKYTVTKCDSTATDSIVIIVEDCCTKNPYGDLVETERAGVTTYDVEVLRQYVKNPSSLIQNTDLYETYTIKMNNCGEEKEIQVIQCFKKWADINEDGEIDNIDVELLMQMVK